MPGKKYGINCMENENKIRNYVPYHMHSFDSMLDSCTDFKEYVDLCVKNGIRAIASTEHGKPLSWVEKKLYCDRNGIKFIHGVECYISPDLSKEERIAWHTVLLAKNYDGLLELNQLISDSTDEEHFYYVNRISFDEFLNLSDNVIKISACVASPLAKLPREDMRYMDIARKYDYYEVQPHERSDIQKEYNRWLVRLSKITGIPLICRTDTHSSTPYKEECRKILMLSRGKYFPDEDQFDLTFQTYDDLVRKFSAQGVLTEEEYLEAIENTNRIADSVENFELDRANKYPVSYGSPERDAEVYRNRIERMFSEKVASGVIPDQQKEAFRKAIDEEVDVFERLGMMGFMLSMSELISWCRENHYAVGPGRGSVGGSRVAYITDITDVNPETWGTSFSRFCNVNRVEIGDIDTDCIDTDRPFIFKHITDTFGADKTARVAAFGTLLDKSSIDEIGRGMKVKWVITNLGLDKLPKQLNDIDKLYPQCPYKLSDIDRIKSEYDASPDKTRKKYPDLFYYFDGFLGTRVSQSVHAAGIVISPITLKDHYGTFIKDGENVLLLDMDQAHDVGMCKYDMLVLRNVAILRDTCRYAGIDYPRSSDINWEDQDVWNDMLRSNIGIFQMEGDFAFNSLKKMKPRDLFDMSLVTACIRPSGESYRDDLLSRRVHHNNSDKIDELLRRNLGYLVYQEDIIAFLQKICGLSGSDADTVRRAIGKKDSETIQRWLPQIMDGYCSQSDKPRMEAEEEATEFLKVIEDASAYSFNYSHSVAYCMIGYLCAYYRYYHPIEFITSLLNNAANDEDIANGTALASYYGIRIMPPTFGISSGDYNFDKETKTISKGIASVKYLNRDVAEELYRVSGTLPEHASFTDVLKAVGENTSIDARQLDVLIRIDYFSRYGNSMELQAINYYYDLLDGGKKKSIQKEKASVIPFISEYATDIGANRNELKSWRILDCPALLKRCEQEVLSRNMEDRSISEKADIQMEYLNYISIMTGRNEDRSKIYIMAVRPLLSKKTGNPWAYSVQGHSIGSGKESWYTIMSYAMKEEQIMPGDVIRILDYHNEKGQYWYIDNYKVIV